MLLTSMAPRLSRSRPFFCSNLTTNSSIHPLPNRSITKVCCVGRQISLPANCLSNCPNDAVGPRVFVTSDLHTDYPDNMEWVRSLSTDWYRKDVLIVAGDVAETYENFKLTMAELKERFHSVFFVPGNHDLWCRNDGEEFACKDFRACKWPQQLSHNDVTLAHYFDMMNEKNHGAIEEVRRTSSQIITFSHFLPRPELCPEKRMLFYPNLPKIIGSDPLEIRLRSIHGEKGSSSACHVFGHTHFCWDAVHDGIRYVQAPLAYPRERKRRMNGGGDWLPFCMYHGGLTNTISPCFWSDYYSKNKREPENTNLAPWVARFYRRPELQQEEAHRTDTSDL